MIIPGFDFRQQGDVRSLFKKLEAAGFKNALARAPAGQPAADKR
jgi:hypothetical protein